MKKDDLTVLLTLRGRHLHTLRWMWYANEVRLPFHVLVADGQVHPTVERLLSNRGVFPNVSVEYHRYADRTFSDYFRKLADATRKVRSTYVMLADNDDFCILWGIRRSIEYLDGNPEYVCAGGQLPDFSLGSNQALPGMVIGEMAGTRFGYKHACRDIAFDSVSDRVLDEITHYQTIWYHVYRTQAMRTMTEELQLRDFSDLSVAEYFMALRAATLGKIRTDPAVICYLRQTGTSMLSTYYKHDWVHHLLRSNLPQDYRALAESIAGEVHRLGGNDAATVGERILDTYANMIRHMLGHTMMRHRFPRLFRIKQNLAWLRNARLAPESIRRRIQQGRFWRKFARDGASSGTMAICEKEFSGIRSVLLGDQFLRFVKAHAPDLMNA